VQVRPETLRGIQELAKQRGAAVAYLIGDLVVSTQSISEDEYAWENYRHMFSQAESRHLFE
jgi:hypothetical protein